MCYIQTKVTPIVEGYGGWAFRMEIVPIESAYPGFGELVVSIIVDNNKERRTIFSKQLEASLLRFICCSFNTNFLIFKWIWCSLFCLKDSHGLTSSSLLSIAPF